MPEPCRGGARNPKSSAVRVVDARSGKEACSSSIGISDTSTLPIALDPPR